MGDRRLEDCDMAQSRGNPGTRSEQQLVGDPGMLQKKKKAGCGGVFRWQEGKWLYGFSRKLGDCNALVA